MTTNAMPLICQHCFRPIEGDSISLGGAWYHPAHHPTCTKLPYETHWLEVARSRIRAGEPEEVEKFS